MPLSSLPPPPGCPAKFAPNFLIVYKPRLFSFAVYVCIPFPSRSPPAPHKWEPVQEFLNFPGNGVGSLVWSPFIPAREGIPPSSPPPCVNPNNSKQSLGKGSAAKPFKRRRSKVSVSPAEVKPGLLSQPKARKEIRQTGADSSLIRAPPPSHPPSSFQTKSFLDGKSVASRTG